MRDRVPVVPGGRVYQAGVSYPPVQVPENRSSIPGVVHKTDWNLHGIYAVIAVLALGLIADGATLFLIAWMIR